MKAVIVFAALISAVAAQTATSGLPPWQTGVVTEDGTCGAANDWVCSPVWGACCSKDGKCGRSTAFCGTGCQSKYGNCNAPTKPPPGPGDPSPDGSCGGTKQFNCTGATYGACCSSSGFCGDTAGHCSIGTGCQSLFGTCKEDVGNVTLDGHCGPITSSGGNNKTCTGATYGACCSAAGFCGDTAGHCGAGCLAGFGNCTAGADAGNISINGECGPTKNGKTCKGSSYGDCCSSSGFCGTIAGFCDAGCQAAFGTCSAPTNITTDGGCGKTNGKTCAGAAFGQCCSSSGFCGDTAAFCSAGCQATFGTCDTGAGSISTDGECGPTKNGKTCKGSGLGDCCSASGFCGATAGFCDAGCQSGFGTCSAPTNITTDGACGKNNSGKTCVGAAFGKCCSGSGFCGDTAAFCSAGCQSGFGTCDTGASTISTDGKCGASNGGKICKGSTFGDCCSSSGFCGDKSDHCAAGCQSAFGTCSGGAGSISTDGKCGASNGGKTCKGSTFGDCCSSSGFCGAKTDHCSAGCQSAFGTCSGGASTISTDGVCGSQKNGKTCVGSTFGNCCSSTGSCGKTTSHCGQGCQKSFSNSCLTSNIPSVDSTCGANKGGWTCAGGDFNGQCCSAGGFCGTTSGHCGSGCQKGFGRCN
ncbi:Chitin recognition protein [Microdochium nivale]|nr:Chitin recognition protein [Microdochium nivale]